MKINNYVIPTKQNDTLKVIVISDLHIFQVCDIKILEKIIIELKKENYDAIYLVGDIIDCTNILKSNSYVTDKILEFISFLGYIASTYIVHGNHDMLFYSQNRQPWSNDTETFISQFVNKISQYKNINILDNETLTIKDGYTISGITPPIEYILNSPDGDYTILEKEREKYNFLNNLSTDDTNTLLCHYPSAIFQMHQNNLLNKINVSVAGHNHNGITQLRVFPMEFLLDLIKQNNRGLIAPGKHLFENTKYLRGNIKLDENNTLIINPAITSLSHSTGLNSFNFLFYKGATQILYKPESEIKLVRK